MNPEDNSLSKNLQEHYRAVSSEFTINTSQDAGDQALAELTELLGTAMQALRRLLLTAESEAVTMSGIKLVLDYTIGKPGTQVGEDEMSKLIRSLTAPKPETPASALNPQEPPSTETETFG